MERGAMSVSGAVMVLGAVILGVFVAATPAGAREMTVSDFAICNQEAESAAGGAASPRTPEPGAAPPGTSQGPGTPGAGPEREKPASVGPETPGHGTAAGKTDPSGTIIAKPREPLLEGMAADRADDAAYRDAYRSCMARRGATTGEGRGPR